MPLRNICEVDHFPIFTTVKKVAHFSIKSLWANHYNLGQNKWKTSIPPPPQIKDEKMARFCPSRGFILDLGGWGFAVPFSFVQDCRSVDLKLRKNKYFLNRFCSFFLTILRGFLYQVNGTSVNRSPSPRGGGGGHLGIFGWVCVARDSKLAPRSKKKIPLKLIPRSRNGPIF